jgi:hypothetical protein
LISQEEEDEDVFFHLKFHACQMMRWDREKKKRTTKNLFFFSSSFFLRESRHEYFGAAER